MKTLLIALAVLTAPTDSLPDLSHPWSFQDCISWAMDHNLTVAGSELTVDSRKIDNQTASLSWLPSVNGSSSQSWSFGRGLGGNNTYERGNTASTNFSLNSSMTLFDGLATPRRIQLAKLNLEAATADLQKARDDVSIQVAQAYVQILYNYEIRDVAAHQLEIDSLQVARLEGLYESGRASAAEVSQQKATLAQSRVTLVQAQNNINTSLLTLAQLLEFPYWNGFEVVRPPVSFASAYLPSPDDIYDDAIRVRPGIRAEQIRLESAKKQIQIAQAARYPSLSLSGGLGTNYYTSFATKGFWEQLNSNFSQHVGLSLNIPIFNKMSLRNQVRSAKVQYQSQQLQLLRVQHNLYKEIQQAWNSAVASQAKYTASLEAAAAAEDAFQLTKAKFENGKATNTEFNEALARLVKAKSDSVQATYECLYQLAIVEFYRGRPLTL